MITYGKDNRVVPYQNLFEQFIRDLTKEMQLGSRSEVALRRVAERYHEHYVELHDAVQ
jgi:signal transduction protein with GAF and PtsI domain